MIAYDGFVWTLEKGPNLTRRKGSQASLPASFTMFSYVFMYFAGFAYFE